MFVGRHEREQRTALLFVVALAVTGCGGHDSPPKTRTPERHAGTTAVKPPEERTAEAEAPGAGPTRAAIMRRLDGRRIRVRRTRVTIDRDTLACGRASASKAGGRRRTIRLRCVQPTFPSGSLVGPDATFLVRATPGARLVITDARFTSY